MFHNDEFGTAAPRSHGETVIELMMQARPNGRLLDHFRVATGGREILEAIFNLTDVISNPELKGVVCKYQFWGWDVNLRKNMMTSAWMDAYNMINSNDLKLEGTDRKPIKAEVILKFLDRRNQYK
jgi:hypothetical protein